MNEADRAGPPSSRGAPGRVGLLFGLAWPVVVATAIVAAFVVLFEIAGISRFHAGELTDADAYTRLQRVVDLAEEGRWYDSSWTRTNAPYGETTHYTRPLDAILLVGAWAASPLLGFESGLWLVGGLISPLLLIVLVVVLRWGFEPHFDRAGPFAVLVLVTCMQPMLMSAFGLGRPDHHSLIALTFAAQLACLARLARDPSPAGLGFVMGIIGGLGIWVSVELLLAQAFVAASLAYLWILSPDDPRPGLIAIRNYTVALAATLAVGLGLERPPSDWLTLAVARISIVHVWIALLAALSWSAIDLISRRRTITASPVHRSGLIVLGGLVPLLGTLLVYPVFFLGPWADFGPVVRAWLEANNEMQPLLPTNAMAASRVLFEFGSTIAALAFIAWRHARASRSERRAYAVILIGMLVYVPFSLMEGRWVRYPQILAAVPFALCLLGVWRWRGHLVVRGSRIPLRTLPFVMLLGGHFIVGIALRPADGAPGPTRDQSACDWPAMADFLDRNHVGGAEDDILFTYVFEGSRLMWETPYGVVATPHGNEESLTDTHRIFDSPTDQEAREVLAARGIDLILICPASTEGRQLHDRPADRTILADLQQGRTPDYRFRRESGELPADRPTLHTRLRRALLPSWLEPVPLPAELTAFRLFRVKGVSAESQR